MSNWVVYRMTVKGNVDGGNAVCEQHEWDAMEVSKPGYHTFVRNGFTSEAAAERMAPGTSGDTRPRGHSLDSPLLPLLITQG